MNYAAEIIGSGSYVPEQIVTNHDLEKMMDTSDEWIKQRSGIEERRWVTIEEGNLKLGYEASLRAIESAGIDKSEIDCIVYATLSPEHDFPGTGCFLGDKLGINGVPAYDIRQQCSAFIYGIQMVDGLIKSGTYKTILFVGAEVHSRGLDKSTRGRDISVLFGDGAGAMIFRQTNAENPSRVIGHEAHADGKFAKELWLEAPANAPGYSSRVNQEMIDQNKIFGFMNGKVVFMHAVRRMCEVLQSLCEKQNISISDIDLFVFHQANLRINEKVADMLGIDKNKVFNTIQKYGNTTAATIPLTLDEAVKAGVLKKGMLVASAAFGSGFTWGSAIYRW